MSDFLRDDAIDAFDRTSPALDAVNRTRAAAGKPLLTFFLLEERNRWLHAYQYSEDPAERRRAADALRRQDMAPDDAARVGRGCPPELRARIARLVGRGRCARAAERGGDPQSVGEILGGEPAEVRP